MPSFYQLKPAFQRLLRPLVRRLAQADVTANQVTIVAMLLSIALGGFLALEPNNRALLWLVPLVLFIRMALNAIDGMLAREHNQQTRLGAFLNELGDVVADAAIYLGIAMVLVPIALATPLTVIIVVLASLSEMTGVLAQALTGVRGYAGPMGKSDRAFCFGALGLLLAVGIAPGLWVTALLALVAALTATTIVNRVRFALRHPSQKSP